MRSAVGALVLPFLLSASLAQAQAPAKGSGKAAGSETPAAPAPVPLQQAAPGAPIPLGILPAAPGGSDSGQAAAPAPGPAAAEPAVADWIGRSFAVPQRTDIFTAPDGGAATAGSLAEGADADVVGVLDGREWPKIRLPDGSFGFVRSASIPAVTGQAAAVQPAAAAAAPVGGDIFVGGRVQGPAAVHDTATLVVRNGRCRSTPLTALWSRRWPCSNMSTAKDGR